MKAPEPAHELPRARLLATGLQLFSRHGYAKTSTRAIAAAAQVNVAAISYYFGDKAGLYRAVFNEALQPPSAPSTAATLAEMLPPLFSRFLRPLDEGEAMRQRMKLHRREMLEPTGVWAEQIEISIKPLHVALTQQLCRHLGLRRADDDVRSLAITIAGLGVHLFVCHDEIAAIAPQLSATPAAIERWQERLVGYANALIAAEVKRRRRALSASPTPSRPTLTNRSRSKPA